MYPANPAALARISTSSALSNDTPLASVSTVVPSTENTWMPIQFSSHAADRHRVCRRSCGVKMSRSRPVSPASTPAALASATASASRPSARSSRTRLRLTKTGDSGSRRTSTTITTAGKVAMRNTPCQPTEDSSTADTSADSSAPTGHPDCTKLYMKPRRRLFPYTSLR